MLEKCFLHCLLIADDNVSLMSFLFSRISFTYCKRCFSIFSFVRYKTYPWNQFLFSLLWKLILVFSNVGRVFQRAATFIWGSMKRNLFRFWEKLSRSQKYLQWKSTNECCEMCAEAILSSSYSQYFQEGTANRLYK